MDAVDAIDAIDALILRECNSRFRKPTAMQLFDLDTYFFPSFPLFYLSSDSGIMFLFYIHTSYGN